MIKVYIAGTEALKDTVLFQKRYREVPESRREKIDRICSEQDKRLSLGAWLLLQKGLADYGIDVKNIRLGYGVNGKPFLKDYPDLFFNLSHSGERVMCAVSAHEIGCDVEKIKENNLKVAKRFFQEKEYEQIINQETPQKRLEMFYRMWTLKESFMKVTGMGMKLPLDSFMIEISEEKITVWQEDKPENYFFKEYNLQDGYKYACCATENDYEEEIYKYSFM